MTEVMMIIVKYLIKYYVMIYITFAAACSIQTVNGNGSYQFKERYNIATQEPEDVGLSIVSLKVGLNLTNTNKLCKDSMI
jgi:hypothetical protein